jgi:transcriptional regulator with XRE-family HTH domain
MKPYGSVIREARVRKGQTLDGLASKVGTHKGYISGIENGKVSPPAPGLSTRLAKALGLDPLDLLRRATVQKAPKALRAELAGLLFPNE